MASASDSTSARKLPPYLAVVPPMGKRFRRPKPVPQPSLRPDPSKVEAMIKQAEYVDAIATVLLNAALKSNDITALSLARSASIEASAAVRMARLLLPTA